MTSLIRSTIPHLEVRALHRWWSNRSRFTRDTLLAIGLVATAVLVYNLVYALGIGDHWTWHLSA